MPDYNFCVLFNSNFRTTLSRKRHVQKEQSFRFNLVQRQTGNIPQLVQVDVVSITNKFEESWKRYLVEYRLNKPFWVKFSKLLGVTVLTWKANLRLMGCGDVCYRTHITLYVWAFSCIICTNGLIMNEWLFITWHIEPL